MEWMILPLKRYAVFSGRSRRKEYWLYALFVALGSVVAAGLDALAGYGHGYSSVSPTSYYYIWENSGPVSAVWALANLVPGIAVAVRRLHDLDMRGWWLLLCLVPFAGEIVLLIFFCQRGTRGTNRFGADPLAATDGLPAAFR